MQRWLFMGNPGSGKSTLLNCLLKRAEFDAGLSFGSGRTQTTQSERWTDDIVLVDTPGIADIEMSEEACDAITAELKHGGVCKLFFVVTMRNGRVSPEDVDTCDKVLRSIAVQDAKFSLIVNNVQKQQYALVTANQENRDRAVAGFGGGDFYPNSIVIIPAMAELDEEDNAVVELPDDVLSFFAAAPTCEIPPSAVREIRTNADTNQAKRDELASKICALQHTKTGLQTQLMSLHQSALLQSNQSSPRAVKAKRSATPQQDVCRSSGEAARCPSHTSVAQTQLALQHQPDMRDLLAVSQLTPLCAAQWQCKCGYMWTPDEITMAQFCPDCGAKRGEVASLP